MTTIIDGDVRGFYAELGIELPAWAKGNATTQCFANPEDHKHGDRDKSCSVSLEHGAWQCHGCGASGGASDAAKEKGYSVADAVALVERHGLPTNSNGNGRTADIPRLRAPQRQQEVKGCALALGGVRDSATVPTDEELSHAQERLLNNSVLVARLWQIKAFSADAMRRLGLAWETAELAGRLGFKFDGGRILFPICDEHGKLYALARYLPGDKRDGKKKVVAHGSRGLFPAPESLPPSEDGKPLYLVEGETKVPALATLGLPVVGFPGISSAATVDQWAPRFGRHRAIVVVTDCDDQGREKAKLIAEALAGQGGDVRYLDIDESRSDGYDIADYVKECVNGVKLADAEPRLAMVRQLVEGMAIHAPLVESAQSNGTLEAAADANGNGNGKVQKPRTGLVLTPFSQIERKQRRWLLDNWIPYGELSLCLGDPGTGKTTFTAKLAADVTTGRANAPAGSVAIVSGEDSIEHTVEPRLAAAGANMGLVNLLTFRRDGDDEGIVLPDHVRQLEKLVGENEIRLLVVDPLMAHLSESVNSHNDQSVRRALAPLAGMAHRTGIAVVVVIHPNKSEGKDPLYRVGGSVGIVGAARAALLFARDPNDPDGDGGDLRVIAALKENLAKKPPSRLCRVRGVMVDGLNEPVPMIEDIGESSMTARDVMAAPRSSDDRSALQEATDFLVDYLSIGAQPTAKAEKDAEAAGISKATFARARRQLGITPKRDKFKDGKWMIALPDDHPSLLGDIADLDELRHSDGEAAG